MSKRYPGGIIRKTPPTPSQTSAQGIWDMASVTQAVKENTWPIAGVPDPISKSLRFRSSASAYLNRTLGTPTNSKIWTYSGWVKRGSFASYGMLLTGGTSLSAYGEIYFDQSTSALIYFDNVSGAILTTTAVYRDPSAWYHIVVAVDTTQATSSNRAKIYVNGTQITAFSSATYPTQNANTAINTSGYLAGLSALYAGSWMLYADQYLAEQYFIDGQALTPSSFGSTNDQTGVWQPIAYTGTYGTNGFYLPFSNTASTTTLGYDFSGNSNNWTTNNISLTSGSTYDSMVDVPTQWIPYNTAGDTGALFRGNYAVINPLDQSRASFTTQNANLQFTATATNASCAMTIFPTSGKYYAEAIFTTGADTYYSVVGVLRAGTTAQWYDSGGGVYYTSQGAKMVDGSSTGGFGATWSTGQTIGIALDLDGGTVAFYKQNSLQGTITLPSSTTGWTFSLGDSHAGGGTVGSINCGQRPFSYTPPSGFKTLNTTNLPTPTIGATASTTANKYFDINTYTGDGSQTASFTNSGSMQPDMVWSRIRSGTSQAIGVFDSVRGTTGQSLDTAATTAEGTWNGALSSEYGYVSAFNSNGFSVNDGSVATTGGYVNFSGRTYVAWQWRASNAAAVTNTAGSISSQVSANTTAGFSIVTWTGPNNNTTSTVGHGLGVTPSMVIYKSRNSSVNWNVWCSSFTGGEVIYLNLTNDKNSDTNVFNNTAPSSTLLTVKNIEVNSSSMVAYCFAQVAGYSAFGSYTGNGSTDGPFIFTGFRPRFVFVKNASSTGSWIEFDSSTNPYNEAGNLINLNTSSTEFTTSDIKFDILSNGFKVRQVNSAVNGSGNTLIYAAFAENPFKYSLAR